MFTSHNIIDNCFLFCTYALKRVHCTYYTIRQLTFRKYITSPIFDLPIWQFASLTIRQFANMRIRQDEISPTWQFAKVTIRQHDKIRQNDKSPTWPLANSWRIVNWGIVWASRKGLSFYSRGLIICLIFKKLFSALYRQVQKMCILFKVSPSIHLSSPRENLILKSLQRCGTKQ
jgi:hypothetical protein